MSSAFLLNCTAFGLSFQHFSYQSWAKESKVIVVKEKGKVVRKTIKVKKEIITKHKNVVCMSDLAAQYDLENVLLTLMFFYVMIYTV